MPASASSSAGSPSAPCARRIFGDLPAECAAPDSGPAADPERSSRSARRAPLPAPARRAPADRARAAVPRRRRCTRAAGSSLRSASASVVFPEPESPERPAIVARRNVEGNAVQNLAARTQPDSQIADFEQRLGWHPYYSMASSALTFPTLRLTHSASRGRCHPSVRRPAAPGVRECGTRYPRSRRIHEARIETLHVERARDAAAKLRQRVPDHPLLLHVQVVKGGNMAAGRNHQVTGSEWVGVRYGDH